MAGVRRLIEEHKSFADRLDAIESAYEYMLAYAAQGRDTDVGAAQSPSIRDILQQLHDSLRGIGDSIRADCAEETVNDLAQAIDADAKKAVVSLAATLDCPAISSQLVDNLNASMHLRAVLTGLFLADEILKIRGAHSG
jgi:cell pole-organizing protein PopZ